MKPAVGKKRGTIRRRQSETIRVCDGYHVVQYVSRVIDIVKHRQDTTEMATILLLFMKVWCVANVAFAKVAFATVVVIG